jgi:serine/threonine-protein kinase
VSSIGRYQVKRQLGRGGMGDVYLAHDPSLERDVAIKLLHKDSLRGLRDEAKVLAALRHPGIVTIYEIGVHDGQDFMAMEYLPGTTLRDVINAGASRAELLAICGKVAAAVAAAHEAGILHRDIKPENVIVLAAGEVKVVDFGVARRLDAAGRRRAATASEAAELFVKNIDLTPDTIVDAGDVTVFGTPAYMAPEVLFGEPSTPASDVYSLGVVIHECLAKRRPHDATTLVEMIAQIVSGPPPELDDPLHDLVGAMLAREPGKRPSLERVRARLGVPAAVRRRPGAAFWAVAVAGLAAAGVAAWALARPTTTSPAAAPGVLTATIAVAPIVVRMPSYGREPPVPTAIGDCLARLFGEVDGAKLTGLATPSPDIKAAQAESAQYLVTGSIDEAGGELRGTFDLLVVPSGTKLASVDVNGPSPAIAHLIDEAASQLAGKLAPAAHLDMQPHRVRAEKLYREGERVLRLGTFTHARAYLEQAVDADPSFADGWYALALALGWTEAADSLEHEATAKAYELAPPGPRKQLLHAIDLFLYQKWTEMRGVLEPLEATIDPGDRRELYYYLGEANWHDGRHDAAFGYFKRALEIDHDFRPATVHAWQYEVARRNGEQASFYVAAGGAEQAWVDFALGRYAELAEHGSAQFKLWSQLILEQPADVPTTGIDGGSYAIAMALDRGDRTKAKALFADVWQREIASKDPAALTADTYYQLESLGEVVIAAGLIDETKTLVAFLAAHSKPRAVRGYPRLSILAAPVVRDASLVVADQLSERNAELADASTAELAGNHAKAAALLRDLVGNPTFQWDYPERAALIRNLRALHDSKHVEEVCADTLHPAVFRVAYLVLRGMCRK